MKAIVTLLATALGGFAAIAAEDPPPSPKASRPVAPAASARPEPPGSESPGPGTTDQLVRDFQQARQAYLEKRKELQHALRGATEEKRQMLRDQLKALREEQIQSRENVRQQLQLLRERLPSHRELIDQARERSGDRQRRGE